jgi:hypothetical protein
MTAKIRVGFALVMMLFLPKLSVASETSPKQLVVQLYHDYAWVVVVGDQWRGRNVADEDVKTLDRYFAPTLVSLLDKDKKCRSGNGLCNLDFDPIYASQDPAIYALKVISVQGKDEIDVSFKYPETRENVVVKYIMSKAKDGWRIKDICYKDPPCLVETLSQPGN